MIFSIVYNNVELKTKKKNMKSLKIKLPANELLEKSFKEWLLASNFSHSAVTHYPVHARELLHYLEKNDIADLKKVEARHIKDFSETLKIRINQKEKAGTLAPATINQMQNAVIKFLAYLELSKGIKIEVKLTREKVVTELPCILSIEEIKQLFDSVDTSFNPINERNKALLSVLYGAGLRKNEVHHLELEDISVKNSTVFVRQGKWNKQRTVPIPKKLMQNIYQYISHCRDIYVSIAKETDTALFIDVKGKRISEYSYYRIISQVIEQSGIESLLRKKISPHTFRHSVATHMMSQGMSIERIAQFLGHSSLDSTMLYTHLSEEYDHELHF